jgi:hypothetical protein
LQNVAIARIRSGSITKEKTVYKMIMLWCRNAANY